MDGRPALPADVDFVPIRDMNKAQVRDALFGARLYIDFGHHPGKDRVPREAAVAGAVVLLREAGAAKAFPRSSAAGGVQIHRRGLASRRAA